MPLPHSIATTSASLVVRHHSQINLTLVISLRYHCVRYFRLMDVSNRRKPVSPIVAMASSPISPADDLEKAKLAQFIINLRNGIVVNLHGMGATVLGMHATVGLLVKKALTSSANPYQGISPGYRPVIALDLFLVQESVWNGIAIPALIPYCCVWLHCGMIMFIPAE